MQDIRDTATWNLVEEHFQRLQSPAFGQVSRLLELTATPDGSRVAATGVVHNSLEGLPARSSPWSTTALRAR